VPQIALPAAISTKGHEMKYVILAAELKDAGVRYAFPFMFSQRIVHAEAAKRFIHLVQFDSPFNKVEVLSAGTAYVSEDFILCQPGSETCKIKTEGADSDNGIRDARIFNYHDSTGGVLL
jgi:hypothetical protein